MTQKYINITQVHELLSLHSLMSSRDNISFPFKSLENIELNPIKLN